MRPIGRPAKNTTRAIVAGLLGLSLLAGCGGGGTKKTTSTQKFRPGEHPYVPPPAPRDVAYDVSLSGEAGSPPEAPAGAPGAVGLVGLTVKAATRELCWQFSNMKNVPTPTVARVYRYSGTPAAFPRGFKLGARYTPLGCAHENAIFLGLLGAKPDHFYVSVHSAHFPLGAVRGHI